MNVLEIWAAIPLMCKIGAFVVAGLLVIYFGIEVDRTEGPPIGEPQDGPIWEHDD